MVLSIIFLEDKHTLLLHLSIFYEYQQCVQHRVCFWIQTPDYKWDKSRDYTCYSQWPVIHYSTFYQFILNMLFNHNVRLTVIFLFEWSIDVVTILSFVIFTFFVTSWNKWENVHSALNPLKSTSVDCISRIVWCFNKYV